MKSIREAVLMAAGILGVFVIFLGLMVKFMTPPSEQLRDFKKEAEYTARQLSIIPPYACFAEMEMRAAGAKWEIPFTGYGTPYMLVAQDETYVLYAQPHPELCANPKKPCHVYWLRTFLKKEAPLRNVDRVICPPNLTREFIRGYIKKNYSDEIDLGVLE